MGVRTVFLVGFMGSGKNTVGQELARRLGWDFVDLDREIERREQRTIPEIFRIDGEPVFRLAETTALQDLLAHHSPHNRVVALGGGAFAEETNRALLRQSSTVFLNAPVEELWRRCQADGVERPLQKDRAHFASLHDERLPLYRQASITIETHGKDPASICTEIANMLRLGAI
ncbi:MAG: shikimate kinase [Terriglobales bacterium]